MVHNKSKNQSNPKYRLEPPNMAMTFEEQKIQEEEKAQTKCKGLMNTKDKEFEKTVEEAAKNEEKIGIEGYENTDKIRR